MARSVLVAALALVLSFPAGGRARNVILFIGDAGGIPTLNAASIHGYREPHALFIQQMPHLALMDTSTADRWVSDSAAGMSAIVTGQKTVNGVISQSAEAVRGKADGAWLQTILEHAEERGLSTGVITNMSIADATPAACYAHSNNRSDAGGIFTQLAKPRFGDGPEVIVGAGRTPVLRATNALGVDIEAVLRDRGYALLDSPAGLSAGLKRVVALTDDGEFDPAPVVEQAVRILSANPRGFFLMVEWDVHTNKLERGLNRVLQTDALVRQAVTRGGDDTLVIFTADHSFDLRVRGGKKSEPLLQPDVPEEKANVRVYDSHTAEHVLVAAQGPGADRVRGFILNSDLFGIMMAAYGWDTKPKTQ